MDDTRKWWKEETVYQIYPRSFQDSNGDGIGDIPGIISRLDELQELGVGVIWLSPIYASPDADNGYDISDYMAVQPAFGTMEDMEELFAEAKKRNIRIIMDFVVNHTSDEHAWFKASRERDSPYRDYYIWREGKNGKNPNNWTGFFMEDTWTYDEKSGEYYLHLFHKKQPDLNFNNPDVIAEVKNIMKFWLEKGAAGFRCDVINIIYKTSLEDGKKSLILTGLEHYKSQPGCHEILRELRSEVLDNYDCFTVGETVMVDVEEARDLCEPDRRELDMLFYFEHLEVDRRVARYISKSFHAKKLLDILTKWQQGLSWNAAYLECHDQPRIVSHYGNDEEYWEESAKLLALMQFTMRGTAFIYQGQEIGMTNFDFKSIDEVDDVETRNINALMKRYHIPSKLRWHWLKDASRDNARTPIQWTSGENAGFTTGKPWLGINQNYQYINYESQKQNSNSVLSFYKTMIALRKNTDTLIYGDFEPVFANKYMMVFARNYQGERYVTLLNFSDRLQRFNVEGKVIVSNLNKKMYSGLLGPWEAMLIKEEKD